MTKSQEKFILKANHVGRKRKLFESFSNIKNNSPGYNLAIKKLYIPIHIQSASRTKINLPI